MAVSASRKMSMTFLFFVFVVGIASVFAPAYFAAREVRQFCEALPLGLTLAEVQARATAQQHSVERYADGTYGIEHRRSLGRVECELTFDDQGKLKGKARQ